MIFTKNCAICGTKDGPRNMSYKMTWKGTHRWTPAACLAAEAMAERETGKGKRK